MRNNKSIIVPSHTDNKNMERYLHKKLSEVGEGGGGGGGGQGNDPNAIHFTEQSLTEEQKAQARANIGAGTYDKPSSGIPASDLETGVIPDVSGKEDTSNMSQDVKTDRESLVKYPSVKAVVDYVDDAVDTPVESTQPSGGFLPNVVYDLGELLGDTTFALAAGATGKVNAYHWTFDTGSTAPTITWPSGIIWPDGFTPSVDASKHYEVLIRNGYASMLSYSLS